MSCPNIHFVELHQISMKEENSVLPPYFRMVGKTEFRPSRYIYDIYEYEYSIPEPATPITKFWGCRMPPNLFFARFPLASTLRLDLWTSRVLTTRAAKQEVLAFEHASTRMETQKTQTLEV